MLKERSRTKIPAGISQKEYLDAISVRFSHTTDVLENPQPPKQITLKRSKDPAIREEIDRMD